MVKPSPSTPSKREAPIDPEDFAFWWLEKIIEAEKTRGKQVKERA